MTVTITRWKLARSRLATGFGFAWKWMYDVIDSNDKVLAKGTDTLAEARRIAKQAAKPDKHVEAWTR